jgi:hypothetical protein
VKVTRVKFDSKMSDFINSQDNALNRAVVMMAVDIDRQAKILAPRDTGALIASSTIAREGDGKASVTFGSPAVRYARRRHFENKKNPQTLRYLERAGTNVTKNGSKYIEKLK